ncbi:ribosome-inactivating family protein [Microbulbifer sp. TYP-18]|uniref:ribosome-inactivating family protein n=1 Tax=Microbulbifer sp. TYP-18 TaxID=3230024 RepID=UPI0034C65114
MKRLLYFIFPVSILIFSVSAFSVDNTIEQNLDLTSAQSYVTSLNSIRNNANLTSQVSQIQQSGTSLRVLRGDSTSVYRAIRIQGLDIAGLTDAETPRFIMDPNNLYIHGFLVENRYYRLNDPQAPQTISIAGQEAFTTVQLNQDGTYTTLERIAQLGGEGRTSDAFQFSPTSVVNSLINLSLHTQGSTNLTRSEARAMLRFITLISEALRFREIQRNIRNIFDSLPFYTMTDSDVRLTLNWGGYSNVIGRYATDFANGTPDYRILRIDDRSFSSISAILGVVAIILPCQYNGRGRRSIDSDLSSCNARTTVFGNALYDTRAYERDKLDILETQNLVHGYW